MNNLTDFNKAHCSLRDWMKENWGNLFWWHPLIRLPESEPVNEAVEHHVRHCCHFLYSALFSPSCQSRSWWCQWFKVTRSHHRKRCHVSCWKMWALLLLQGRHTRSPGWPAGTERCPTPTLAPVWLLTLRHDAAIKYHHSVNLFERCFLWK